LETRQILAELSGIEMLLLKGVDGGVDQLSTLTRVKSTALVIEQRDTGINSDSELKGATIAILPVEIEPARADARAYELLPKGKIFRLAPVGGGERRGSNDKRFALKFGANARAELARRFDVGVPDVGGVPVFSSEVFQFRNGLNAGFTHGVVEADSGGQFGAGVDALFTVQDAVDRRETDSNLFAIEAGECRIARTVEDHAAFTPDENFGTQI
jgi:hypothetical protein